MSDTIQPPWTDEQVEALNKFQTSGYFHPFTCPNRGDGRHWEYGGDTGELVATNAGWICRDCDYVQDWAHTAMADPRQIETMRKLFRQ